MRKPTVKNKYNLTMAKIRKLKIVDRSKVGKPLFWRMCLHSFILNLQFHLMVFITIVFLREL